MKKATASEMTVECSSGNVFFDLGLENADELLVKADLMNLITREIEARGLSQKKAAALVGLSQSDISNIARNDIDRFSQERLLEVLRHLGLDVEIHIHRSNNGYGTLRLREHA